MNTRFRRRKEAGYTPPLPNHHRQTKVKTARKPHRQQPATSKRDANAKGRPTSPAAAAAVATDEEFVPVATSPGGATTSDSDVDVEAPNSERQLPESASTPAKISTAAATAATVSVAGTTAIESRERVSVGEIEGVGEKPQRNHDSPRARQRLEEAKALDKEVGASQGGG